MSLNRDQGRFTLDKYLCYMSGKSMQRLYLARFFFFYGAQHTIADDVGNFLFFFVFIIVKFLKEKNLQAFLLYYLWFYPPAHPGVAKGQTQANLMKTVFFCT